jgi:hypothetical protein
MSRVISEHKIIVPIGKGGLFKTVPISVHFRHGVYSYRDRSYRTMQNDGHDEKEDIIRCTLWHSFNVDDAHHDTDTVWPFRTLSS